MTQIAINSINIAINVNGNLNVASDNLDAVNGNLGPVNGNLDAIKKQQIAFKISILLFFLTKTANSFFYIKCLIFISSKQKIQIPNYFLRGKGRVF